MLCYATCGGAIWHRLQRESVQHSAQGPSKTAGQGKGVTASFTYSISQKMWVRGEERSAVQGTGHRNHISAKMSKFSHGKAIGAYRSDTSLHFFRLESVPELLGAASPLANSLQSTQ